jgi:HEAT repeat protein
VVLSLLLHAGFCEWTTQPGAELAAGDRARLFVLSWRQEPRVGVFADRPELGRTTAFTAGVVLPVALLAAVVGLVWWRRRKARTSIARYLADLLSPSEGRRLAATRALADFERPGLAAVSLLGRALSDDSLEVRLEAAQALARLGPRAATAVPELTAALGDSVFTVREHSARALGKIGSAAEGALPALEELERDEKELVRLFAREAMQRIRRTGSAAAAAMAAAPAPASSQSPADRDVEEPPQGT